LTLAVTFPPERETWTPRIGTEKTSVTVPLVRPTDLRMCMARRAIGGCAR